MEKIVYDRNMKIKKTLLPFEQSKTHGLVFIPENLESVSQTRAIMTHGYTSDKSSILNWAIRLCEAGVPVALFDLPGHYLGNFSEVKDFEFFKNHAHELFWDAFVLLEKFLQEEFKSGITRPTNLVLAGHSLGAMLSIFSLEDSRWGEYFGGNKLSICVGLGMSPPGIIHLFDTPFYKSTLDVRSQLVSESLHPSLMFPWIKEQKENLKVAGLDIHLIVGDDDIVVGADGADRLLNKLTELGNTVSIERPSKLPHHEPQLAASYIKKYLKKKAWMN